MLIPLNPVHLSALRHHPSHHQLPTEHWKL